MWNVQETCFIVRDHRIAIDAEEIYFLGGLPCHEVEIDLYWYRRRGKTNATYLMQQYTDESPLKDDRINIKAILQIPLKAIRFTIACLCGTATLHFLTKAQIQTIVDFFQGTIFNWCEDVVTNLKGKLTRVKTSKLKQFGYGAFLFHFLWDISSSSTGSYRERRASCVAMGYTYDMPWRW